MRRLALRLALTSLLVAACGGNPPPDSPDGGLPDGQPDAMPASAALIAQSGTLAVTQLTFNDTPVGVKAGVGIDLGNVGTAGTDVLALTLTGAEAGDFAIDAATTCNGALLAPGARCHVALTFAPTAAGARTASLHVTGAGAPFDLPLAGKGLPALPAGLVPDVSSIDFGSVEIGQEGAASILLSNTSAAAIKLGTRTTSAGFSSFDNCPDTLTAGGACTVTVSFKPTATGTSTGTFTASWTGGDDVVVALSGVGLRRVTITRSGGGAGKVTSAPAGIDCGTTCSALFPGAVTLTATPDASSQFAGWDALCDGNPTCAVPDGGLVQLNARFEPKTADTISITYAGGASGIVLIYDETTLETIQTCTASCSTVVAKGAQISLHAFTPSKLVGWSGACTATTHDCNLGTVVADRDVTVTFAPDAHEVTTLYPARAPSGLGFAPDGDLIVADSAGVARMTPAGVERWRAGSIGGVAYLAVDAAGDSFAYGAGGLSRVDATGAVQWTKAVAGAGKNANYDSIQPIVAASADGTVVAVLIKGGAHVFDGDGADRFTISNLIDVKSVAVTTDGTVAIATDGAFNPDQSDVHRFSKAGAELETLEELPGGYDTALTADGLGNVCAYSSGHGSAELASFSPTLQVSYLGGGDTGASGMITVGVAAAPTGEIVGYRAASDSSSIPGLDLTVVAPAGGWSIDKPYTEYMDPAFYDGLWVSSIATDGKHVAVGGSYAYQQAVLQIYAVQ
jgi:HYDIN/CFA65/VesB-like, Ig-like domain/Divergent InlB B-repeat domain